MKINKLLSWVTEKLIAPTKVTGCPRSKHIKFGGTELGYGANGLLVGNVFSVSISGDDVTFREECDGHNYIVVTKAEAIELLSDSIVWIKAHE